jgi:hypothetical protein
LRRIEVFFYGLFMDEELLRAKGVTPTEPCYPLRHRMEMLQGLSSRKGTT